MKYGNLIGRVGVLAVVILTGCNKERAQLLSEIPRAVVHHFPQVINNRAIRMEQVPAFVVYGDGTVIWRNDWSLANTTLARSMNPQGEVLALNVEALIDKFGGRTFNLTTSSDPEVTVIWANGKTITIRGSWKSSRGENEKRSLGSEPSHNVQELPSEVVDVLNQVMAFSDDEGLAWRPERVRLILERTERPAGQIVAWPERWPQNASSIMEHGMLGDMELSGDLWEQVQELFPSDGQIRAVEVMGDRWFPEFSPVFPGEGVWKSSMQ